MKKVSFSSEQETYLNQKLDIVLHELQNFRKKLEEKSLKFEENFIKVNKKIDENFIKTDKKIDETFIMIDTKVNNFDKLNKIDHKDIMENIARLDRRITKLQAEIMEEHHKTHKLLNSINSAFIKYETEGLDKLRVLFDANIDRQHHQDIYGHEFVKLNDLIAKNSFRISNLEKQHQ